MKKIVFVGLIAATSISTQACAEKDKCNPDGNQNEITACADNDYKAADKALNTTWKALINKNKANKSYIAKIKASQNHWIKFRDAEVAAQFACDDKNARTCWGSMLPMLQLAALTDITEERTKRLQSYIDANPESELTGNVAPNTSDCYIHKGSDKDKSVVHIDQTDDIVSGYFARLPYEKDQAHGELKGTNRKDLIRAEYTFEIEGEINTEEVVFKSDIETLTEGIGQINEATGEMTFKDLSNIQWGDVYSKVDCADIKKSLSYSREVLSMLDKQK